MAINLAAPHHGRSLGDLVRKMLGIAGMKHLLTKSDLIARTVSPPTRPSYVLYYGMTRRSLLPLTDVRWIGAVDDYELGHKSGRQIARELDMSPASVSRRMKASGAEKCARVDESIRGVVAVLDYRARQAAKVKLQDSQRRRMLCEANTTAVGLMVEVLFEADRQGDLSLAAPAIKRIGAAIGPRRRQP